MRFTVMMAIVVGCAGGDEPELSTACEGEYSEYEPGMRVMTEEGSYEIEIVDAQPNPPDEGDNAWRLALHPVGDASPDAEVMVTPWMPAHGHGISPPDYVAGPEGDVPVFDLIMPGVWEFKLTVTTDETTENASVSFCIQG